MWRAEFGPSVNLLADPQHLARALPLPPTAGEHAPLSDHEAGTNYFFNDRGEQHMRTATVLSAVLAAGLGFGAATLEAQTSANIQATATVLSAVTVAAGNDLQFGNVTPGVNKTIAIADAGAGRFDVTKAATQGVTLSFTLPTNLTDGGNNLPIGTWTGGWNTSATPAGATAFTPSAAGTNTAATAGTGIVVYVGATVSPGGAQVAGNYSGTVTMSVVYF